MVDFGLLVLRVIVGGLIAAHGSQKLFGLWGGPGVKGTQGMMQHLNIWPPHIWAWVAIAGEFGGGLLTVLGFMSPLGPLMMVGQMLMAISKVHWTKGFWNTKGGFEFPFTLMTIGVALGLTGPGRYSVDRAIGFRLPEPLTTLVGLVATVGTVVLGLKSPQLAQALQGPEPIAPAQPNPQAQPAAAPKQPIPQP